MGFGIGFLQPVAIPIEGPASVAAPWARSQRARWSRRWGRGMCASSEGMGAVAGRWGNASWGGGLLRKVKTLGDRGEGMRHRGRGDGPLREHTAQLPGWRCGHRVSPPPDNKKIGIQQALVR